MTVNIIWSLTAGGVSVDSLDEGSVPNGTITDSVTLFVRHDGVNPITDAKLYFAAKTGVYTGDLSASEDFAELLEWGDAATLNTFGGIQVNMDAVNAFSGGSTWGMSETQKTSVDSYKYTVRTAVGASSAGAVLLSKQMSSSMTVDGTIPAGVNDASLQFRVKVPVVEGVLGIRQFIHALRFTSTT